MFLRHSESVSFIMRHFEKCLKKFETLRQQYLRRSHPVIHINDLFWRVYMVYREVQYSRQQISLAFESLFIGMFIRSSLSTGTRSTPEYM